MSEWTDEEQRRFGGLQRLYGIAGAERIRQAHVVVVGIGAAGIAVSKMLLSAGVKNLIGVDRHGAIYRGEPYSNDSWNEYAHITNPNNEQGPLSTVIEGADVFVGLSGPGVLKVDDLKF
jgi:malate dehydrogenase (oxaloacetate-decarboxylating)